MGTDAFEVETHLPATPAEIYQAWLDAKQHSLFTGARATTEPRTGGAFTAWDGYIRGHIVDLYPNTRIVQEWITTEFPADAQPSRLEITLEAINDGTTVLKLKHSNIPEGQGESYKQGWDEHYFQPMLQYFQALRGGAPKPPPSEVGEPGVGRRTPEKLAAAPAKKKVAAAPAPASASAKKAAAKKAAPAKKAAAKKAAPAKKAAAKKAAPAKKAAAKKAAAKKTAPAKKAAPKKKPSAKKGALKKKTGSKKTSAKKKTAAKKKPGTKRK